MKGLQLNATWQPRPGYEPTQREKNDRRADVGYNIWHEPRLDLINKPTPEPKDDEVLVKIGAAGVCGSDTTFLVKDSEGYTHYEGHCRFPCIIGHEFSGEVVGVGKKVRTFSIGDIITAETMNWCGECMPCRMGLFNQCQSLEEIGFTLDGGFAEYLVVKEKFCFNINDLVNIYGTKEMALKVGALVEPTAVSYNGLFICGGGFMPGSYVGVFGCGATGLTSIILAKAAGAAKIIVFDLSEARLELARKIGADYAFNPIELQNQNSSSADAILEVTKGLGAHVQVEATENHNKTFPEIEKSLAIRGKIIQIGISSNRTSIASSLLQKKGASYFAFVGSSGHGIWPSVIRLMASGKIDVSKIISKCYSLDNAIQAIQDTKNGTPGKNIITPNG
jgi:hypothetical protein